MRQIILNSQHLFNRINKLFNLLEQAIGTSLVLQMAPEALNRIQVGAVRWQPEGHGTVLKKGQHRFRHLAMMVGSIVHNQNDRATIGDGLHQMLDEGAKGSGILLGTGHEDNLVGPPVVSANQMVPFGRSRSSNPFLTTPFHPTLDQDTKQGQGRFVHKEKFDFAFFGFFLSSSSVSSARSLASLSCSGVKSCLGRR